MIKPNIVINYTYIIRVQWVVAIVLILMGVISSYIRLVLGYPTALNFVPKFNLDGEANFPTYFSSFNLMFSAVLLGLISKYKKNVKNEFTKHWCILALLFVYLSLDEATTIHDIFNSPTKNYVFVGLFVSIVFLFFYYRFLKSLPRDIRTQFITAGSLYIAGAVGFEYIAGFYRQKIVAETFKYSFFLIIEESLEIVSIIIFINALLKYVTSYTSELNISFK